MDLASQKIQLQTFKVYINEVKVKKKRKVEQTNSNKKFVTIANIQYIQIDIKPIIIVDNNWLMSLSNLIAI